MMRDSLQFGITANGIHWHINKNGSRIYSNECGGCGCKYYTNDELHALRATCDLHISYGQSSD